MTPEQIKQTYPDLYRLLVALREAFGPLTLRIRRK